MSGCLRSASGGFQEDDDGDGALGVGNSSDYLLPTSPGSSIATTNIRQRNSSYHDAPEIDFVKVWVLSVIILLTIVGNASVVLSILVRSCRHSKVTRMYFFILHLSIADILTAFFTLLPEFFWTFTFPKFYGGNLVCKAMKYCQTVGPYLSSYTLVMTAVDRYQVRKREKKEGSCFCLKCICVIRPSSRFEDQHMCCIKRRRRKGRKTRKCM